MRRSVQISLALGALATSLMLTTCSSDNTGSSTDPCPSGICGSGGSAGTSAGNAGTSQGGDAGNAGNAGNAGAAGSSGCVEAWLCTPWETTGSDDNGTRTCTDQNKCGTTSNKPKESATLPALDLDFYKCNVEPIFDRGCALLGCHGTELGRALRTYARGRLRHTGETWIEPGCLKPGTPFQSDVCIGSIECGCFTLPHSDIEWRKNYDAARGFGLDPQGAPIPAGMEDKSELIAQPITGGKAHAGVHLFKSGDADHKTLKDWLSGKKLGMTCTTDN